MKLSKKYRRILILDDDDVRHLGFSKWLGMHDELQVVHVTTVAAAKEALSKGETFDLVFLDHDLNDLDYQSVENNGFGPIEITGFEVARFIVTDLPKERRPKAAVVHSWNPPGASMMCEVLRSDPDIKVRRWAFNPTYHPLEATGLMEPDNETT